MYCCIQRLSWPPPSTGTSGSCPKPRSIYLNSVFNMTDDTVNHKHDILANLPGSDGSQNCLLLRSTM